jgi:hypothetical protein
VLEPPIDPPELDPPVAPPDGREEPPLEPLLPPAEGLDEPELPPGDGIPPDEEDEESCLQPATPSARHTASAKLDQRRRVGREVLISCLPDEQWLTLRQRSNGAVTVAHASVAFDATSVLAEM